jgi:hypothetical protein
VENPVPPLDQRGEVGATEILLQEGEPGARAQTLQVGLLQMAGIIRSEGIDPEDAVTAIQERFGQVRAKESRHPGDQDGGG